MSKTLVIAEKPSVGRDLARVLPGPFEKKEGYLESPEHVVTWAVGQPVQRLWLQSMTRQAIEQAFGRLRPGAEMAKLEQAARSRSEADWIVGMNATRAATIRLRSSFDGAVSLGRVQTPTLAIVARREEEIRE